MSALSVAGSFTTRELTPRRWGDFEALFRPYRGVQAGCWCMFYHRPRPNRTPNDALRTEQNRQDHARLVRQGRALGILVYQAGRPIGWCQFGLKETRPRIDAGRKYRALGLPSDPAPLWRITCFFVAPSVRRHGVTPIALAAALRAIRRRGGGIVEAYPSTHPRAVATWFGGARTFRHQGFCVVAPFGRSNVVMRRRLRPLRSARRRPSRTRKSVSPTPTRIPHGRSRKV